MYKFIFYIILLISIYLPFEDFLLKWLPVSEFIYMYLRQIPDLIIISTAALLFLISLNKLKLINKKADFLFICFIIYSILLIFINGSGVFESIRSIKSLIRYILIVYIILKIGISMDRVQLIVKSLIFVAVIQSVVAILQVTGGESIRNFFTPRSIQDESAGIVFTAIKSKNEAFGTMAFTTNLGYFLNIGILLTFFIKKIFYKYSLILLFLFAIILSGSRTALFSSFIALLLFFYFRYNKWDIKKITFIGTSALSFIAFLIYGLFFADTTGTNQNFWVIFSSRFYTEILPNQRLGLVIHMFQPYFLDFKTVILGLSPDRKFVVDKLVSFYDVPSTLKSYIDQIEDIYWFALIAYYGLIGFILFAGFYFQIYKKISKNLKNRNQNENIILLLTITKTLLVVTLITNFFNQVFELRHFSFYLWLFVGISLYMIKYSNKNIARK